MRKRRWKGERNVKLLATLVVSVSLLAASPIGALAQEGAPDAPVQTKRVGPGGPPPADVTNPVEPAAPVAPVAKPKAKAPLSNSIHLSGRTPVAPSVRVHDKVLEECRLQSLLPQTIADRNSDVVLTEAGGSKRLDLEIVDIHAPSGGWFSGPKWITVEGRLLHGKTVQGSFVAKETSMASATACGMLSKVITVLAGDIASWLQNPTNNAKLGNAR
jgi:hypothetical protein